MFFKYAEDNKENKDITQDLITKILTDPVYRTGLGILTGAVGGGILTNTAVDSITPGALIGGALGGVSAYYYPQIINTNNMVNKVNSKIQSTRDNVNLIKPKINSQVIAIQKLYLQKQLEDLRQATIAKIKEDQYKQLEKQLNLRKQLETQYKPNTTIYMSENPYPLNQTQGDKNLENYYKSLLNPYILQQIYGTNMPIYITPRKTMNPLEYHLLQNELYKQYYGYFNNMFPGGFGKQDIPDSVIYMEKLKRLYELKEAEQEGKLKEYILEGEH